MNKTFHGFVMGALVGATATMLLTPKSGKEARKDFKKRTENAKSVANQYATTAKERGSELKQAARSASSDHAQSFNQNVGRVMEQVKETMHAYSTVTQEKGQELKETIQEARSDYMESNKENVRQATSKAKEIMKTKPSPKEQIEEDLEEMKEIEKSYVPDELTGENNHNNSNEQNNVSEENSKEESNDDTQKVEGVNSELSTSELDLANQQTYDSETLKADVTRRTMDELYDEEKAEEEDFQTINISTEQTKEPSDKDERKTTNTNVGI